MATDKDFMEYLLEQMAGAGDVSARKMFGEYAVYLDGKVVALVCDNQLFMKPTDGGRKFLGDVVEAPPYSGAKPSFLIDDLIEDGERLHELLRITARELPLPVKKKRKRGTM